MAKLPTKEDMHGLDPAFLASLVKRIPPNPLTGKPELNDIMKFMTQHPEELQNLVHQMDESSVGKPMDYANYDFNPLAKTVKPRTPWVLQLQDMGLVDGNGNPVDVSVKGKEREIETQQFFIIYVYDEKGRYRSTQNVYGNVTAGNLVQALQQAMAKPLPPLKPAMPSVLMISLLLQRFNPALRSWLDTLPPPFTWRFETEEESRSVSSGISSLNEKGFDIHLGRSSQFKQQGNEAFKKKDRTGAVDAYAKAIDELEEALIFADMKGDVDAQSQVKSALAVCYANRAAAWCIEGAGIDANKAIDDGKLSEEMDKVYNKAYYRQAKAHMILEQRSKAENVLIRALSLPELENDNSLVDFLIDLQTDGRGLSQDEGEFKQWVLDLVVNNVEPGRAKPTSLKGEWKRRCDAMFEKFENEREKN